MGTPIVSTKSPLTGGLAPAGTDTVTATPSTLGLPKSMDLASLMLWLTDKMRDSDSAIRAKMADMSDRKAIQSELNDLTIAFREARSGLDSGGGYLAVKPPLDNPDAIRKSEWFNALDSTARDQVNAMLNQIHPPMYQLTGGTVEVLGKTFNKGDSLTFEEAQQAKIVRPDLVWEAPARIHKDEIERAVQNLGDLSKNLSSNDEISMIELQSIISARGQLLQMVSNMIASFNSTAMNTVGNFRG